VKSNPYINFSKKQLILRDHLAIDRTILANESTFLAHVRTSLALIAGGITLAHFLSGLVVDILGGLLIIIGITLFFIGYIRYKKMLRSISEIKRI
jgi:putative membrane protein